MERITHHPVDKSAWLALRAKNLNSTEVSALFGHSPYVTEFELYHRMASGFVVEIKESGRMRWGTRLQGVVAEAIAENENIEVRLMDEYIEIPEARIGSSFDFEFAVPQEEKLGVLEIKVVNGMRFKDKDVGWQVDEQGNIEAPLHIELQLQHQLLVSRMAYGKIGVLVDLDKEPHVLNREAKLDLHGVMLKKCAEFWKRVDDRSPPPINFERDAEFVAKLYNEAEAGTVVEADAEIEDYAREYRDAGEQEKLAVARKKIAKAKALTKMQTAAKVLGPNFSISAGEIAETVVPSYTRKGYRDFRISWRK